MTGPPGGVELRGLLGAPVGELRDRLSAEPATDRASHGDRWLVFGLEALSLRVRCSRGEEVDRVSSWTATFEDPPASLRAAAELLGLWPELEPDVRASEAAPMLRRPLRARGSGAVHSVTASVREGGVVQMTAFDEPPDWTEP